MRPFFLYLFENNIKDGVNEDDWKGPWKYKDMQLEDHFSLDVFKISRLLDKITRLQVTSPDMKGREKDIPISLNEASTLKFTSDNLMVCRPRLMILF